MTDTPEPNFERKRVWKTPPNVPLCAEADIADPGSRSFVLQIGDAYFHGFVVRKDGQVAGYVDRCPHQGFPLAIELDRYLTRDGSLILCGWHGAVFEPLTGQGRDHQDGVEFTASFRCAFQRRRPALRLP